MPKSSKSNNFQIKIAKSMLERYTGSKPQQFYPFILLTNFKSYFEEFSRSYKAVKTTGSIMETAHSATANISMVNFRMGAPTAALVMDTLSYLNPQALLMLGMCGGLHPNVKVGEFILPMAAIRNEGTSQFYMPSQVPALPTFKVQMILSQVLVQSEVAYKTGVIHSTDYRFWEFDADFKKSLKTEKAMGIEMECSSLFIVGFKRKIPVGALLLVSDLPLKKKGIKTNKSSEKVFKQYSSNHVNLGVQTLKQIQTLKPEIDLRHFEW